MQPLSSLKTLGQYIVERQADFPNAKGGLTRVLKDIVMASKIINREVNKAGLVDALGKAGSENIQGEAQQKLDVFGNDQFISAFRSGREVCGVGSEELDDILAEKEGFTKDGKYIVLFDPLDGSSNIDVNVSIGTIFSIYRRKSEIGAECTIKDFLQKGSEQIAAGYVIYGSSTMLVLTTGNGVNGFTLDPSIGTYCLSHPNMRIPEDGKIYSVNESRYRQFSKGVQAYIDYCHMARENDGKAYASRYIGSMVADLHRNLIKGGVFIYPATLKNPTGKLRLLYECNPMAFIVEQAGGKASYGGQRILDIEPTELHQRMPIVIGSPKMVDKVEGFIAEHDSK